MWTKKIDELLLEYLTLPSYNLYNELVLPDIFDKSTSSSGTHHIKKNGEIPTQGEHIFNMLCAAIKMHRMLDLQLRSLDFDVLLLAIVLHDSYKYGINGLNIKSNYRHDKLMADMIETDREIFLKVFTNKQIDQLIDGIRFHSGRWSTDMINSNIDSLSAMTLFIHFLDMGDTNNILNSFMMEDLLLDIK